LGVLWRRGMAAIAAVALVATACGDGGEPAAGDTTDAGEENGAGTEGDDGPSFIYITPTPIGVNKFLELGEVGTEAAAERLGGTARTFESTDLSSRRANLEAAVDEAPTVIVLTTFEFTELGAEFAEANPDQSFILIDACPDEPPPNLRCGVFREHEGAYLLGVMAGLLTETDRIGSVVALDIPFLRRWSDGFAMGAESVNPDVTDSQVFIGGDNPFSDPPRAKELALALAAQDVDHMFAVGAGSNGGIFEAAEEEGFFSYGVDVDQCSEAPGHIVDNNLKRVDVVVESLIDLILDGTAESVNSFGLAEEGTGVVALQDDVDQTDCVIKEHPDIIDQVRDIRDQIVDGSLEIPDPMLAAAE
jgi:basic membrane protein A